MDPARSAAGWSGQDRWGVHLRGEAGLVVQSDSGMRYIRCQSRWEAWNEEYGDPWRLDICSGDPPTVYNPGFASLPQPVVDCSLRYAQEWAVFETDYALLDDGSAWEWGFSYGVGTSISYWIGGLIAGLIVEVIVVIFVWRWSGRSDGSL